MKQDEDKYSVGIWIMAYEICFVVDENERVIIVVGMMKCTS